MELEEIKRVISESKTINETLMKLGRNTSAGSYKFFKKLISTHQIDISHFLTKSERAKQQFCNGSLITYSNEKIFSENSTVARHTVKKRILNEKLIDYKCCFCGNTGTWMGKKITLILDHINGINNDNRIENLRFVCPNCDSTLDTYCRGHKKRSVKKQTIRKKPNREHLRKVIRPSIDDLKVDIETLGYSGTGRKYGVSDNAIRKWASSWS